MRGGWPTGHNPPAYGDSGRLWGIWVVWGGWGACGGLRMEIKG
jgi:hypothetical protein